MSIPFIEKYRAKDFEELIDIPYIPKLKEFINNPKSMPNLLFYGSPGVGKTTVAQIFIDKLQPIQVLKLNGSDSRGIDVIRTSIRSFSSTRTNYPKKPKIIWFEEFDYLTEDAFAALRGMIEKYLTNTRYISTCNFITSIPEAIQSRFMLFEFKKPNVMSLVKRLREIADKEHIEISDSDIENIVKKSRQDVRTSLNYLQQFDITQQFIPYNDEVEKVFKLVMDKKWTELRYVLPNLTIDKKQLLLELEQLFFLQDNLSAVMKASITELIAHYLYEMKFSFDENITVAALMSKLIKVLLKKD